MLMRQKRCNSTDTWKQEYLTVIGGQGHLKLSEEQINDPSSLTIQNHIALCTSFQLPAKNIGKHAQLTKIENSIRIYNFRMLEPSSLQFPLEVVT